MDSRVWIHPLLRSGRLRFAAFGRADLRIILRLSFRDALVSQVISIFLRKLAMGKLAELLKKDPLAAVHFCNDKVRELAAEHARMALPAALRRPAQVEAAANLKERIETIECHKRSVIATLFRRALAQTIVGRQVVVMGVGELHVAVVTAREDFADGTCRLTAAYMDFERKQRTAIGIVSAARFAQPSLDGLTFVPIVNTVGESLSLLSAHSSHATAQPAATQASPAALSANRG